MNFWNKIRFLLFTPSRLLIPGELIGHIGVINPKEYLGEFDLLESLSYFLISELIKRTMQENQDFLAYHDGLTGLLNRESYYNYIHSTQEDTLSSIGGISGGY